MHFFQLNSGPALCDEEVLFWPFFITISLLRLQRAFSANIDVNTKTTINVQLHVQSLHCFPNTPRSAQLQSRRIRTVTGDVQCCLFACRGGRCWTFFPQTRFGYSLIWLISLTLPRRRICPIRHGRLLFPRSGVLDALWHDIDAV